MTKDQIIEQVAINLFVQDHAEFMRHNDSAEGFAIACWKQAEVFANAKAKAFPVATPKPTAAPTPKPTTAPTPAPTSSPTPAPGTFKTTEWPTAPNPPFEENKP